MTEEEITELCQKMKEVAIADSKSKAQKEAVKDVTKNILLSWGLLAEAEDGSIHPTNGYVFFLGKMAFFLIFNVECSKGKPVLFLWINVSTAGRCGSRPMMRSNLCCETFILEQTDLIEAWGSGIRS